MTPKHSRRNIYTHIQPTQSGLTHIGVFANTGLSWSYISKTVISQVNDMVIGHLTMHIHDEQFDILNNMTNMLLTSIQDNMSLIWCYGIKKGKTSILVQ